MIAAGYYDQDFEPWVRGIRSIGSAIAQQPLLRAAAQDRTERAALLQAQIGTEGEQQKHYAAGSRNLDAETSLLVKKGQLVTALEQSAPQAQQDIAAGQTDTPAVRTFSGAISALTGANGDDVATSFRSLSGALLGRQGKVTEAASVEDPVGVEKARIMANRGQVVQPGGAVVKDGKVVVQIPSAASQQAGEYEEIVEEYPAVDATEGTPAQPAKTGWFGGSTPATPATPGTPYQPKRVVKKRRKLTDALPAGAGSQPPNAAAPAAAGAGKPLDAATAKAILAEVGGDKAKARELAKQRGYNF